MNKHEAGMLSEDELWDLAQQDRPIDPSEIGITTQKTHDGLQLLTESWELPRPFRF
ncbi:MAG: hypothetical protein IJ697_05615 [Synergistaceae bacterium]|nr:hypothetical protein [Synergistaceae bacterium]